jgi:hypothetical protein
VGSEREEGRLEDEGRAERLSLMSVSGSCVDLRRSSRFLGCDELECQEARGQRTHRRRWSTVISSFPAEYHGLRSFCDGASRTPFSSSVSAGGLGGRAAWISATAAPYSRAQRAARQRERGARRTCSRSWKKLMCPPESGRPDVACAATARCAAAISSSGLSRFFLRDASPARSRRSESRASASCSHGVSRETCVEVAEGRARRAACGPRPSPP